MSSRKKKSSFLGLKLFVVLVLLLAVSAAFYELVAPATPPREAFVDIAPGTGSPGIAAQLEHVGAIRNRYAFMALRLVNRGTLQAGEYRFADPSTMSDIYGRLHRGDIYFRVVTVPEGFNIFEVAAAVEASGLATKDQFLTAARRNVREVADFDSNAQTVEGYLFPDSYHFQRLETPDQMVGTMVRRFRQEAKQLGIASNFHQIVTMASLIEKETPLAADRPLVSSVLNNRLKKGMPLMTDPTVIYAAMLQHRYRGAIYQSDLQAESAYNTYKHTGLPPGPICNPGVAALTAAIHPAASNYFYFVADPSAQGHSRFASTLEEHNRNVQAYRNAQRASAAAP